MPPSPFPPDEKERLAALRRYAVLDTPPEGAFDRIADLAARLFDVPLALVSLVDADRQWFKSCRGVCQHSLPQQTPREIAFCAYTILSPEVLVVEDARLDPRFADNPLVTGETGLRFYAGAPLIAADGAALGSLCLMDYQPRSFSPVQCQTLRDLAASVVSELELRRAVLDSTEKERVSRQMFEDSPQPMWVFGIDTLQFIDVNRAALALYGYRRDEFLRLSVLDLRPSEDRPAMQARLQELAASGSCSIKQGVWRHQTKNGVSLWMEITARLIDYHGRTAVMTIAQDVTERRHTEAALRLSEQKLALHIQNMPLAAIDVAPDMTIRGWNPAAEQTFGYSAAEAVGQNILHLIVPEEEQAHVLQVGAEILTHTGGTRSTNRNRTKSGDSILCDWYNTPLIDDAGEVIGCASLARDVTDEVSAQERLRRSEAHKAAILATALDCIISIDQNGVVTEWNPASTRTFGYSQAEAVGRNITELIIPHHMRAAHHRGLAHFLLTGEGPVLNTRIEVTALHQNGREFPVELTATSVQIAGAPVFTAYVREITDQKALEVEREELLAQTESLLAHALARADHDPLTGLLNHRVFHKRLKEETGAGRRGAVLLVDLDNFKFFNDAYGHLAGDDVLRQVAQAFGATCRAQDTLARFGGDEFALLLPGVSLAEAHLMAEDLRDAVRLVSYHPPGYEMPIPFSLSVGIACFPEDATSRTDLMEAANTRLRIAKSGGDDETYALQVRRSLAQSVGGFSMLDALVTAVDNKDRYTRRHSEDVMQYSRQIACELGLDTDQQRTIEVAALLHDVGKIGVPDSVLRKPGKLTDDDYEAIQQHPMMGAAIVGGVAGFEETLDAVRHHHERWDGRGYPFGLRGEETPLPARLMAVADAYSAMTTDRPYRRGMSPDKALQILEDGAGTQWDPRCVQAFLAARRRVNPDRPPQRDTK